MPLGQVVVDELAAHLAGDRDREWLFVTDTGEPLTTTRPAFVRRFVTQA